MQRKLISSIRDKQDLDRFVKTIKASRYFRNISLFLIKEMLNKGEFIKLKDKEFLVKENKSKPPDLILLLKGSLQVKSHKNFIMRLNQPGDIFGEISIINQQNKISASIISEEVSQVIIFPNKIFKVKKNDSKVSVAYLILSHIFAEKLRIANAQSMLKNNLRKVKFHKTFIGIIDPDQNSRKKIISVIKYSWEKTRIIEIESYSDILNKPLEHKFDFFIIDPDSTSKNTSKKDFIRKIIEICYLHKSPILVVSKFCKKEDNRKFLADLGVNDFLTKPFYDFDLSHKLITFRKDYFRQKEIEQIEIAADTDRLTGLANRRKMDEFLDALITIFPEEVKPFSIIIADIDNFKNYNDKHGHQLGDNILSTVASILKNNIRKGDLVARFGGEEFVIILPNCSKDNAVNLGNKLRIAIADKKIPFQEEQPLGNLTCTFGVATFPQDAENKEDLLKRADEKLYIGKSSGKNKLVAK